MPARLLRPRHEDDTAWLASAVAALPAPPDLRARNLAQLLLAERYQRQFSVDLLTALRRVRGVYRQQFPH